MKQPTLSVIVPTIARASLTRALASIVEQPGARRVEIVVVGDSHGAPPDYPSTLWALLPVGGSELRTRIAVHDAGHHCWGHCQRNFGMQLAEGAWLAFLDDDDCWAPGAWPTILSALDEVRPHIFRMRYPDGGVLWRRPRVELGNVGTPMFVVPNDGRTLGRWGERYEGDLDFIRATVDKWPGRDDAIAWHRDVIALIRTKT